MNCKFCQGTGTTVPRILSYPKVARKFNQIRARHFPHALGKQNKNMQANKNTHKQTKTPPNNVKPKPNTYTHAPNPNRSLPESKKLKAQEQEGISSPCTAQGSENFSLLSQSTKHQIKLGKGVCCCFPATRTLELLWREKENIFCRASLHIVIILPCPFTPSSLHSDSRVTQALIHLTCQPHCWKADHTSAKMAAPDTSILICSDSMYLTVIACMKTYV